MAETKEKLIKTSEEIQNKEIGLTEIRKNTEKVEPEIRRWIERIEDDPTKMKTVNDINGQPLLTPAASQKPVIVLPITRSKFIAGFKKTVDNAGRWLSTFIFRLIKIKDGKVKFKEK